MDKAWHTQLCTNAQMEPQSEEKIRDERRETAVNRERVKKLAVLKNKFFKNMSVIKEQAPHIADWFEGSRNKETEATIIEECFKKDKTGHWQMKLDSPFFKESKTRCVCV